MKKKYDYVIVGKGNLAKHLKHYFSLLEIGFIEWQPEADIGLDKGPYKVLLAVHDNEIDSFISENNDIFRDCTFIHFSSTLDTDKAVKCNPLMTFRESLYSLSLYKNILFCLDEESPTFEELFPSLPNPNIVIPGSLKPYYNNLCSLVSRFTSISWEKFYDDVVKNFDFSSSSIESFLSKAITKIDKNYQTYMDGFINGANDFTEKLSDLNLEPVKKIYDSFLKVHNEHIAELFSIKKK